MPKPTREQFSPRGEVPYQEPFTKEEALEEIERVRDLLGDPKWPDNYSTEDVRAAYDLAKECGILTTKKSSPEVIASLLKTLEKGRYIGPLETQNIDWSNTKILRDIVQNFYDGMAQYAGRPTVDGVRMETKDLAPSSEEENIVVDVEFRVSSPAEYDHRYLIHHGGTTKFDDPELAGDFGEGVKVASFLLMKNGYTDRVELGSGHWKMIYYLDHLPEEDYPQKVRGLFVRAEFVKEPVPGNYLKFAAPGDLSYDIEPEFRMMKDFFYSPENPDFKDPTFESDFGGFKILPKGQKGNLYIAGQRYEYGAPDKWSASLEGITIWTNKKVLQRRRDRSYAAGEELTQFVLQPLVEAMTEEQAKDVLKKLEEWWEVTPYSSESQQPPVQLVQQIIQKFTKAHKKPGQVSPPRIPAPYPTEDEIWKTCIAPANRTHFSSLDTSKHCNPWVSDYASLNFTQLGCRRLEKKW